MDASINLCWSVTLQFAIPSHEVITLQLQSKLHADIEYVERQIYKLVQLKFIE